MSSPEDLANQIYNLLEKPVSERCLYSANIHANAGDWDLVVRAFLAEASDRGTKIPKELIALARYQVVDHNSDWFKALSQ